MIETHYSLNPQLIFINRYELIRMSRQALLTNPGNLEISTPSPSAPLLSVHRYPRAGFAFHNDIPSLTARGVADWTGCYDQRLFFGFDFAF